jgi:hypothetical protein
MPCSIVTTKKYKTRKGPPYHAKDCKQMTRKGNDKKKYRSLPDKKGVYKWVQIGNKGATRKKGMTSYTIIFNGSEPFVVDVYPSKVEVFRQQFINPSYIRDKKVLDQTYQNIFIGDNDLKDNTSAPKGKYKGNSILLYIRPGHYLYIGNEIYSFETKDNEMISTYFSPVGNSDVPYPYAVGEHHTYFMLDKEMVPTDHLDLKKDGYAQFYGYIDTGKKDAIESSKKKYKFKMLHK